MSTAQKNISLQDWSALYDAALAFKDLRCWEWMYDSDLFGVQDPDTGEVGYCCVLGNLGEVFALNVYLGAEGLDSYWALHELAPDLDFDEEEDEEDAELDDPDASDLTPLDSPLAAVGIMNRQRCLMASFEERSDLDKEDLSVIRKLGLKFRGKQAWPLFRDYSPGFYPWFLTLRSEVRFLTLALQQAKELALRMKENPDLLIPPDDDDERYLVRVRQDGQWRDTWQIAPEYEPPRIVPVIDEEALRQLQHSHLPRQGEWEADCLPLPMPVKEGARPFFPYGFIVLSGEGMPLGLELLKPGALEQGVPEKFMGMVRGVGRLPQVLRVASDEAFALLEPVATRLGVTIEQIDDLPALRTLLETLTQELE
jgi:hypothetical protein